MIIVGAFKEGGGKKQTRRIILLNFLCYVFFPGQICKTPFPAEESISPSGVSILFWGRRKKGSTIIVALFVCDVYLF